MAIAGEKCGNGCEFDAEIGLHDVRKEKSKINSIYLKDFYSGGGLFNKLKFNQGNKDCLAAVSFNGMEGGLSVWELESILRGDKLPKFMDFQSHYSLISALAWNPHC